jgi:hypothetical protein
MILNIDPALALCVMFWTLAVLVAAFISEVIEGIRR